MFIFSILLLVYSNRKHKENKDISAKGDISEIK